MLRLQATVEDDVDGSFEVIDQSISYKPGISTKAIVFTIPSDMQTKDIPFMLVGEDNQSSEYVLRITPGNKFGPFVTIISPKI